MPGDDQADEGLHPRVRGVFQAILEADDPPAPKEVHAIGRGRGARNVCGGFGFGTSLGAPHVTCPRCLKKLAKNTRARERAIERRKAKR